MPAGHDIQTRRANVMVGGGQWRSDKKNKRSTELIQTGLIRLNRTIVGKGEFCSFEKENFETNNPLDQPRLTSLRERDPPPRATKAMFMKFTLRVIEKKKTSPFYTADKLSALFAFILPFSFSFFSFPA